MTAGSYPRPTVHLHLPVVQIHHAQQMYTDILADELQTYDNHCVSFEPNRWKR
jgi:hypothetical protein